MDRKEFVYFCKKLNKAQRQMAHLLGISTKAVRGYVQGWRRVPGHVERQVFFWRPTAPHVLRLDQDRNCPESLPWSSAMRTAAHLSLWLSPLTKEEAV